MWRRLSEEGHPSFARLLAPMTSTLGRSLVPLIRLIESTATTPNFLLPARQDDFTFWPGATTTTATSTTLPRLAPSTEILHTYIHCLLLLAFGSFFFFLVHAFMTG